MDGYTAFFFKLLRIQEGAAFIDPSLLPYHAGKEEYAFSQCSLARVHVSEQSDSQFLHTFTRIDEYPGNMCQKPPEGAALTLYIA